MLLTKNLLHFIFFLTASVTTRCVTMPKARNQELLQARGGAQEAME